MPAEAHWPASQPLRIYIAGSHGVGKTTLARWISKSYGLPLITEVARQVLAELEIPLHVLRVDPERTKEFQREVFRRQAREEDERGGRFVSDRCCDNLAYAAEHTLAVREIISDGLEQYAERLKAPESLVFLVRPHRSLLPSQEDGVRERADWDAIMRIDGIVRFILEYLDVDYVSMDAVSMPDRIRTVRAALRGMGARAAKEGRKP